MPSSYRGPTNVSGGSGLSSSQLYQALVQRPAVAVAPPIASPVVAGIEPQAFEAILYGKEIPLFCGGKALIGGRIIEGPFFGGTTADPSVSFVAHHANNISSHAFSLAGTQVTSARLRGQEVWNSASQFIATDKVPVGNFDWRPGHNAQSPFAQSSERFGLMAPAYPGGILSSWKDIPLKPFGGIIPFPSILVETSIFGDPDNGIPRADAIRTVLEYMGLFNFEFEVDVSGSDPAWLLSQDMTLEDFLKQLRSLFINYRISYTNKLHIIEPDSFDLAYDLTNENVLRDTLEFTRIDPLLTSIEKQYAFIDVDRDYEPNTVTAREDRFPHPTTDAASSTKIDMPIVTTSSQALADVHNSLYEEMASRNQMDGVGDATLFGMEVGDGVRFNEGGVIDFFGRVKETQHDFENWTVEFNVGEVLNCGVTPAPEVELGALGVDPAVGPASTLNNHLIGTAAANRLVIVVAMGVTNNRTISSITINGNAATIHVQSNDAGDGVFNDIGLGIASLLVPTGTTANIVVNWSGLIGGCAIQTYSAYGLVSTTPTDTATATLTGGGTPSTTIDVAYNGLIVTGYGASDTTFPGSTANLGPVLWSGVFPEDFDDTVGAGSAFRVSVAHSAAMLAQNGRTISAASTTMGRQSLIAATWA